MNQTVKRVGTVDGGCVMCELPSDEATASVDNSFAAALALAETVKGDPDAFDVCPKHRDMIQWHREACSGKPRGAGAA